MPEPPPAETPTTAARVFIGGFVLALAFRCVDKFNWNSWHESVFCGIASLALAIMDFKLPWVVKMAGQRAAQTLNLMATDARWWVGSLLGIFVFVGLSDVIPFFHRAAIDQAPSQLYKPTIPESGISPKQVESPGSIPINEAPKGGDVNAPGGAASSGDGIGPVIGNSGIITKDQSGGQNTVINQTNPQRRLSPKQTSAIKAAAKAVCSEFPFINVIAANSDHEAQVYATDFVKALKSSGCNADLSLPIPGLTPDVTGVHIGVRDFNNIDPHATMLQRIISQTGIRPLINPMKGDFFPAEKFVLIIGGSEL